MIVNEALANNVVIIAATGNTPAENHVGYPAAYPAVVAVGGVDKTGNYSPALVTGPEIVIAAPSDAITTAHLNRSRTLTSGTSNSAAIVAGIAALLRARYPDLSAPDIVHRLTTTATDKGPPGRDDQYGYGLIDPIAALTTQVPASPSATSHTASPMPPPAPAPGNRFPTGAAIAVILVALAITAALARTFTATGGHTEERPS